MPSASRCASARMTRTPLAVLHDVPEEPELAVDTPAATTPTVTPPESLAESETATAAASPAKTPPSSSPSLFPVHLSLSNSSVREDELPSPSPSDVSTPRKLGWDELWASWPHLSAEQTLAAQMCATPLEIIHPAAYTNVLGRILNFDVPPVQYPPVRTTYYLHSAWTTAKLHLDRGMHLGIVRRALALHFGRNAADFDRLWTMLWGALQAWHPSLKRRTDAIAVCTEAANLATLKNDHIAALVAHARIFLYTLPLHYDGLSPEDPHRQLVLVGENALVSMARCAAVAMRSLSRHNPIHPIVAAIGYDAAKAALWRADLHDVVAVRAACDAGVILYDMLDGKDDPRAQSMLDDWATQSRNLREVDRNAMFRDVDDSLRSDFFRCNPRNEHYW